MARQAPEARDITTGRSGYWAAAWLAGMQWALCVVLAALAVLFGLMTSPVSPMGIPLALSTFFAIVPLGFSTVGAFVASRRPTNPIGWIFCGTGSFFGLAFFFESYLSYSQFVRHDSGISTEYAAWFLNQLLIPVLILTILLLLLLFPTGKLPTRLLLTEDRVTGRSWWQGVVWMAVAGSTLIALQAIFATEPSESGHYLSYPLTVSGTLYNLLVLGGRIGSFILVVCLLFAGASLISRLMLSRGDERQQLKWFVYAFALQIIGVSAIALLKVWTSGIVVGFLGFGLFPIVTGVAILKHHLYDIDVVINRTLVYGALTSVLGLVYFGGVTTTQALFQALTSQQKLPQLAIVVSTLVIAALFNPLRRRIQGFIDRRFYRRKYDARKTLEAFSAKLRNETDLDALSNDLVGVVRETMQPSHVGLWLKEPRAHA
jgi:hypothetical protein